MSSDFAGTAEFTRSVAPWLSVRESARAVDFYKAAFGSIEVFRLGDPGGAWWPGFPSTARSSG